MKKPATWIVTITVRSKDGSKPDVRTLCSDTVFCSLTEGQTARWTLKKKRVSNLDVHKVKPVPVNNPCQQGQGGIHEFDDEGVCWLCGEKKA